MEGQQIEKELSRHLAQSDIGNCQHLALRWSAGAELTLTHEPKTVTLASMHHGCLRAVSAVPSNRSSSRHLIPVMLAAPAATCGYHSSPLSAGDDTGCVG